MLLYGNFTRFFQTAGFYCNRRFSLFLCFYNTFSIYRCNLFIRGFICKFCHILWRCLCFDAPFFAFFQGFPFRYTRNLFYLNFGIPGHLDCSGLFENTSFCCNFGCSCTHTGNYTFFIYSCHFRIGRTPLYCVLKREFVCA